MVENYLFLIGNFLVTYYLIDYFYIKNHGEGGSRWVQYRPLQKPANSGSRSGKASASRIIDSIPANTDRAGF
jgi:hypothetical protein